MTRPSATRRRPAPLRPLAVVLLAAFLTALLVTPGARAQSEPSTLHLDAEAAARRAVEVSHGAGAADERVAGARSRVAAADAARLPTVAASASAEERSSVPELTVPLGPGGALKTIFPDIRAAYGLTLGVDQPLYTGGRVTASRRASRHELDASRADARGTRSGVALRARLAYWQAAAARADVDAALSQQKRAETLLSDARSLRKAGMAVDADVLAAEARTASTRLAVLQARTDTDDRMAELRSLLDVPAGTELELADAMPGALPPAPEPLADLQSRALDARPEVAALAARVDASAAQEDVARAAGRPTVGASAGWTLARPNMRYLPLADEWNDSWSVGVSARWSLWDGGRTAADVGAAKARRGALAEQLADARRQVDLDVERARLGLSSAREAVEAADAAQKAAAARLDAEKDRYEAGLSTTADVLDAQADLAAAETRQVEARTGAWMAQARLDWAVGR
jgi:outer membrane protein